MKRTIKELQDEVSQAQRDEDFDRLSYLADDAIELAVVLKNALKAAGVSPALVDAIICGVDEDED